MKVYLAASFSRQSEMQRVAELLRRSGVGVTSRWLQEDQSIHTTSREKKLRECAITDINDVKSCDVLVRFADDLSVSYIPSHLGTGARHFEMGLAYALGKILVLVGKQQNVFDFLPNIVRIKDTEELLRYLNPEEVN